MITNLIKRQVVNRGFGPLHPYIQTVSHHAWFGKWMREHPTDQEFPTRFGLYDFLNSLIEGPIAYIELGVYEGESIRYWSDLNSSPESRFWGFDSFEGLPEDWVGAFKSAPAGAFTTEGRAPQIEDERVSFVKGWFQDTLEPFLGGFEPDNRLVVHFDADLYSSTLYALAKLDAFAAPGTIFIFDEFSAADGEARALVDYSRSFLRDYEVLGRTPTGKQLAVELL